MKIIFRKFRSFKIVVASIPIVMAMTSVAKAEVYCTTTQYSISGYADGMPALEGITLVGGQFVQGLSLCGTTCGDQATNQRLSIALTARAIGAQLVLYYISETSCTQITYMSKPFFIRLAS